MKYWNSEYQRQIRAHPTSGSIFHKDLNFAIIGNGYNHLEKTIKLVSTDTCIAWTKNDFMENVSTLLPHLWKVSQVHWWCFYEFSKVLYTQITRINFVVHILQRIFSSKWNPSSKNSYIFLLGTTSLCFRSHTLRIIYMFKVCSKLVKYRIWKKINLWGETNKNEFIIFQTKGNFLYERLEKNCLFLTKARKRWQTILSSL